MKIDAYRAGPFRKDENMFLFYVFLRAEMG